MLALPLSWRRSIRSMLAAGCLLIGSTSWAADFTVTNNANAGAGSLRQAILNANAAGPGPHNINFAPSTGPSITLATALPAIANTVNLNGPGVGALTINGNNTVRIFYVESGTVNISGLNLTGGRALGGGGGNGRAGGGGGLGAGGAVYVNTGARVTLSGVNFGTFNATGGTGGNGSAGIGTLAGGGGGGLGGRGGNGNSIGGGGGGGGLLGNGGNNGIGGGGGGGGQGGGITTQQGNGGNGGSVAGGGGGGNPNNGGNGGAVAGGAGGAVGGASGGNILNPGGNGSAGGGGGGSIGFAGGNGGSNGGGGAGGTGGRGGNGGAHGGGGGGGIGAVGGLGGFGSGGGGGGIGSTGGLGGFGGGRGGNGTVTGGQGGGGGSAFGGAVFVRSGGTLTVVDGDLPTGNSVTAGTGGTGPGGAGAAGTTSGRGGYIDVGSTLVFQANATHLVADEIAGAGALNKTGSGILNITSANLYTGPTTVLQGTLNVNGSLVSPTIVQAFARLGGTGSVGPGTINGIIAPGNSIGSLTFNGNYVQNPGSVYEVEINAAGQSDRVIVNGAAQINGGVVRVLAENGVYRAGTSYTILTATGGVSGQYDSSEGAIPGFFVTQLLYQPNSVLLQLIRNNFEINGLTFNQTQVAQYLDGIIPTAGTDIDSVIANLQMLDPSQLPNALDQISGVQYPGLLTLGRLRSLHQHQLLAQAIRPELIGSTPSSVVARGSAPDNDCEKVEICPGYRAWSRFYGLQGNVSGDLNAAGFDYNFTGFLVGLERQFGECTRVGVFGGYNHTNFDYERVYGTGDSDGLLVGVYGVRQFGPAYVLASAAYGYNDFDVTRGITFAGINRFAQGNPNQHEFDGYVETGVNWDLGGFIIQPLVGFQYLQIGQNGFAETGAGSLNRVIEGQSSDTLWFMPGVRIARPFECSEHCITPIVHARWVNDWMGEDRFVSGSLSGVGGSFLTQGAGAGRSFLVSGVTLAVSRGTCVRMLGDYTFQTSGKQYSHTGSGGLEVRW